MKRISMFVCLKESGEPEVIIVPPFPEPFIAATPSSNPDLAPACSPPTLLLALSLVLLLCETVHQMRLRPD